MEVQIVKMNNEEKTIDQSAEMCRIWEKRRNLGRIQNLWLE
jgi:hypothetical protein